MSVYLSRYANPESLIQSPPDPQLGLVITIPAFNEPDLLAAIKSLAQCQQPTCAVEVIVVINYPQDAGSAVRESSLETFEFVQDWAKSNKQDWIRFHILMLPDLPKKHAGVGLARKIAMDEATRRLESIKKPKAIITGFDADCTCQSNYLQSVEDFFNLHPSAPGASIYFEHPVDGELGEDVYNGIIGYELHLRYYVHAMRWSGHPSAFQTVGSAMAVRSDAYQKQGGMNRRKAGEDFYFLQRIIALGEFGEITDTVVYPSARPSERVPFGTGRAILEWLDSDSTQYLTYNPQIFGVLKQFYQLLPQMFTSRNEVVGDLDNILTQFLNENDASKHIHSIRNNAASFETFAKGFYQWFDGLKVLQFINFATTSRYQKVPVVNAVQELFPERYVNKDYSQKELLMAMREFDRSR